MNTDIYKISNSKIIGRVLPFFARGRKMVLFLEAAASPLISLHNTFVKWTYEMVVKLKISFQTTVIIWYLNHKFKAYFADESDSFEISQDNEMVGLLAFNISENTPIGLLGVRIVNAGNVGGTGSEQSQLELLSKPMKDIGQRIMASAITIHAPALSSDEEVIPEGYTNETYANDIKTIIDEYKTSFVTYNIVINS